MLILTVDIMDIFGVNFTESVATSLFSNRESFGVYIQVQANQCFGIKHQLTFNGIRILSKENSRTCS